MTCLTCGSPRFRKGRGESPRYIEASCRQGPPSHIPSNWELLSIETLMVHFDRTRRAHGAPQRTVEALMYSLRSHGTKALQQLAVQRRLSELSEDQIIDVGNRLQRLPPEIACAWTATEVETLFQARTKCPKALSMHV
jgi:hypothetical protein